LYPEPETTYLGSVWPLRFALERRVIVSKYDSTHRLRPIEAARENARVKGESFDEEAGKKLKPQEKQEALVS
jgi:hypothetical protein